MLIKGIRFAFPCLIICVLPIGICALLILYNNALPSEFCTIQDEVLNTINANLNQWIEEFQRIKEFHTIRFSISSGKQYVAISWTPNTPEFFVPVKEMRNEPFGVAGYVYKNKDMLDRRYKIEPIGNDIYCYSFK